MFSEKPIMLERICCVAVLLAAVPANAATRGLSGQPKAENAADVSIEMTNRKNC